MKSKKLKLGIIGGGPNSWIGHVHRIAARFDDKYILVAGVFSRNSKKSISFGKSLGIDPQRCYSNYSEMADKENKLRNKIDEFSFFKTVFKKLLTKERLSRTFSTLINETFFLKPKTAE